METKLFLLNHFQVLQAALEGIGGSASLDMKTFMLSVSRGDVQYNFHPQFLAFKEGKKIYTPRLSPEAKVFIGWLPYFNKRWEISNEKLKFKEHCSKNGILFPEYSLSGSTAMKNVLIKSNVSSFGNGIHGPFSSSANCKLSPGEFFESFVSGKILKIWYWNAKVACVESQDMPDIVGDGRRTLREMLIARLERFGREADMEEASEFLSFSGKNLNSVIPDGQRCVVDFRYGSRYYLPRSIDTYGDTDEEIQPYMAQLVEAGPKLWSGIPDEVRHDTLSTVDAILDAKGKVWFLEMNSNPFVHPMAYPHILDTLFPVKVDAIPNENNQSHVELVQAVVH